LTAAIFEVGATGAQMALFPSSLGVDYRLAPFNATGNPTNVRITDPTFDCAGISATAITVLPGANNTVIELNTIGGLTGACSTAGVLVRADRDTNNDQARDDTDGDGVLEDTVGTRIRANTFDAQLAHSGPAIWLEENVVGVGDPNVGALEDQPPFEQCTGATAGSNHTVIGSSSANAGFDTTAPFGPVVGNGPGADDGNLITSTTGSGTWAIGIRSEGSHICIRGNVILTPATGAATGDTGNGIQLDPGANGTAVWGNIIGSLQVCTRGGFCCWRRRDRGAGAVQAHLGHARWRQPLRQHRRQPGALHRLPSSALLTTASSAKTSASLCRARAKGRKEP
jgi:hypothetical protein